jgi:hypothetical protein
MSRRFIDSNGKYISDRNLKLLLTFVLMDKMGRISGMGESDDEGNFIRSLEASAEKIKKQNTKVQSRHATQDPVHFVKTVGDNMRRQGWTDEVIWDKLKSALHKKSDKDEMSLSDEQIKSYVSQYLNSRF